MTSVIGSSKRKLSELDPLGYEFRKSAHVEVISKIRRCALERISDFPKKEHRDYFLNMRLFHFVLTQDMYFEVPEGISESVRNCRVPFNHIRIIEALAENGCKPNGQDFDLVLKQKKFFAAFSLIDSGRCPLTKDQQRAFDEFNLGILKAHLNENKKLGVDPEELPKAINRYLFFQKASKECLALFFSSLENGPQFLQACVEALPVHQDIGIRQQLRQKLTGIIFGNG